MTVKRKRAYIIRVDGSVQDLDHQPTLEEAQKIVGGYIELVRSTLDSNKTLVVNEEGRLLGFKPNMLASNLYIHSLVLGDVIVLEGWKSVK